ncbi:hypothetical protein LOTGIDRAFT_236045 [Lottia gigantea]|uniref:Thymidine kinase n=1 Tax=Lottia gigantea TaxID=225164 RepID=V3ZR47_LOTGI|nr:hypothetical protein LOTGIDRAFT_236045 [Lottia gigantea]ESO85025.1 hypothetical protein LOTGIDRAFT_236045 [Lottia gigantea]
MSNIAPANKNIICSSMGKVKKGEIQIIFGPMFSGKTTELVRRLKRYQIANYNVLVIKYSKDTRYDDNDIATHDRQTLPAVSTEKLYDLKSKAQQFEVIGIDEGQFFPDVVKFCNEMANAGKTVIVAALDGTFQKQGFGNTLELVPLAEHIIKLSAVCMMCYNEAYFTKRKSNETAVEVIGGADKYLAVCRSCHESSPVKQSPQKRSPFKERSNTPQINTLSIKTDTTRKLFDSSQHKENSTFRKNFCFESCNA